MTGIQLQNFDLKVVKKEGGTASLAIGNILQQNQAIILAMHEGELRDAPALGVGIEDMLLDEDLTGWTTKIRENMQMDGQKVESVKVTRQGITINSEYEG